MTEISNKIPTEERIHSGLEVLALTSDIVSSYISNHSVSNADVTPLIEKIHSCLDSLYRASLNAAGGPYARPKPAVAIAESVTDDYIICLEDGKPLQMLKRHLKTVYNMSIEQYKERWGLSPDYPVVSPKYARRRSQIAKQTGLGSGNRKKPKIEALAQAADQGIEQVAVVASR